ncbi:gamma-tubulin complex component 3 [Anaeramoeba ignava]|uniref:Gamma-tubulin complex component 3 n=1 Tax=Anaeramoeba ignava TaxID=1746090 RepID=A0A9Q0LZM5_ANAIG|nr:gamma-tubulin complex component 3 [Anaeramoeba ignava]
MFSNEKSNFIPKLIFKLISRIFPKSSKKEKTKIQKLFSYSINHIQQNPFSLNKEIEGNKILEIIRQKLFENQEASKVVKVTEKYHNLKSSQAFSAKTINGILLVLNELQRSQRNSHQKNIDPKPNLIRKKRYPFEEFLTENQMKIPLYKNKGNGANTKFDILETYLVDDVICALEGKKTQFVEFDSKKNMFQIKESVGVPKPARHLIAKICELAWIYKQAQEFIEEKAKNPELTNKTEKAFCESLKKNMEKEPSNELMLLFGDCGLTLHSVYSQVRLLVIKYKVIYGLVDSVSQKEAGQLLSTAFDFFQHGDRKVKKIISRILTKTWQPILDMIYNWITRGKIDDPFAEFFIHINKRIPNIYFWKEKYLLIAEKIPKFINAEFANKIFLIGKNINFMRICNKIHKENEFEFPIFQTTMQLANVSKKKQSDNLKDSNENVEDEQKEIILDNSGNGDEKNFIEKFYEKMKKLENEVRKSILKTNKQVLETIHTKFHFMEHCTSIKNFLLCGRGDFIYYLIDCLGDELSKPVNTILEINLGGLLNSAIRKTNAGSLYVDIIRRLEIELLKTNESQESQKKILGWDAFCLKYKVDFPITTVINEPSIALYSKIFLFLWRLKRAEFALSQAWQWDMISSALFARFPGIAESLHKFFLLRSEMTHCVYNLQHYVMFEVLECSWNQFCENVHKAEDLDSLIDIHEKYLDSIFDQLMLTKTCQSLIQQIYKLLSFVMEFKKFQDKLHEAGFQENRGFDSNKTIYDGFLLFSQKKKNVDKKNSTPRSDKIIQKLPQKIYSFSENFQMIIEGFIDLIVQYEPSRPILSELRYRLDFNQFYEKRIQKEMKAVRIAHTIRSSAKKTQENSDHSFRRKKIKFGKI